jgi:hypothetical protein
MLVNSAIYSLIRLVGGFLLPAYSSFKAVERKNAEATRAWLIYWRGAAPSRPRHPSAPRMRAPPPRRVAAAPPLAADAAHCRVGGRRRRASHASTPPRRVVLVALTTAESLLDLTLFWLPLFYEAKAVAIIALWHPRTRLAAQAYDRFLAPLLRANEARAHARARDPLTRLAPLHRPPLPSPRCGSHLPTHPCAAAAAAAS